MIDSYAEQALVGAMLIDEDCCKAMLAKMRPDDFGSQWYRQAFEFMAAMAAEAVPIDPVTVAERFEDREFAGQLLLKAMEATPTAANADEYADLVKKNAARRRLSMIGEKLAECSPDFRADAVEGLAALQGVLDETTSAEVVSTAVWADSFLDEELEIIQDPTSAYCATGWMDLDKLLGGGLFRAGFYVLGARPGMGKTMYIPSITVSGAVDVNRNQINGTFNRNWNNAWQAVELDMDREWNTLIDPMDIDETGDVATIGNITLELPRKKG